MSLPPAEILNKVAATTKLQLISTKIMFKMDQKDLDEQVAIQRELLTNAGVDRAIIGSYISLAPLLAERDAITEFLSRPENSDLSGMLANPATPREAALIAQQDLPNLTPDQMKVLQSMMQRVM